MPQTFHATVRDISAQGLGVADHPDGRAFFIRGAWPGDEGEFEIESVEKKYGFARIVKLTKESEARTTNPCPHSGSQPGLCGGCPWLGIRYSDQLIQKQKMVSYLLHRSGAFENGVTEVLPILPSANQLGYRNRAQFKTDGKKIGFVSTGTKTLAPIEDCLVLTDKNRQTLRDLLLSLPNEKWTPQRPYLWNFLEIDEDVTTDQIRPNLRRTFKQANDEQNKNMRRWLEQKIAGENKNQTVIELFSGSGNFTEVLSKNNFAKIVAAEVDKKAVAELNQRALPAVTAVASDLFYSQGWRSVEQSAPEAELLVLDPPRDGFKALSEFVSRFQKLKKIFYISCEVSHFANEVKHLKAAGWMLKEVQPLDQFPNTPHIEILAEIVKKGE